MCETVSDFAVEEFIADDFFEMLESPDSDCINVDFNEDDSSPAQSQKSGGSGTEYNLETIKNIDFSNINVYPEQEDGSIFDQLFHSDEEDDEDTYITFLQPEVSEVDSSNKSEDDVVKYGLPFNDSFSDIPLLELLETFDANPKPRQTPKPMDKKEQLSQVKSISQALSSSITTATSTHNVQPQMQKPAAPSMRQQQPKQTQTQTTSPHVKPSVHTPSPKQESPKVVISPGQKAIKQLPVVVDKTAKPVESSTQTQQVIRQKAAPKVVPQQGQKAIKQVRPVQTQPQVQQNQVAQKQLPTRPQTPRKIQSPTVNTNSSTPSPRPKQVKKQVRPPPPPKPVALKQPRPTALQEQNSKKRKLNDEEDVKTTDKTKRAKVEKSPINPSHPTVAIKTVTKAPTKVTKIKAKTNVVSPPPVKLTNDPRFKKERRGTVFQAEELLVISYDENEDEIVDII